MDNVRVEIYQSADGLFHYEYREYKVPRTRLTPCGLNTKDLRHAAWFDVGDTRGGGHYTRSCDTCSASLIV